MNLVNLTRTFTLPDGVSDFTGVRAEVCLAQSNVPARLYSQTGALYTADGRVPLGAEGILDVWVTEGQAFKVSLVNVLTNLVYAEAQAVDPQSTGGSGTGMTPTQSSQLAALWESAIDDGKVAPAVADFNPVRNNGLVCVIEDLVLQPETPSIEYINIDWGDGNGVQEAILVNATGYEYAAPGTYQVTVWARNFDGTTVVTGQPLTKTFVLELPPVGFGFNPTQFGPLTMAFIPNEGIDPASLDGMNMDYGDGTSIVFDAEGNMEMQLVHVYASAGTYTPVFTLGSDTWTQEINVTE